MSGSTKPSKVQIDIDMDDAISQYSSQIRLSQQTNFDPSVAMELGNLTRVSYKDYEHYENKKEKFLQLLEPGKYIYAENINKSRSKSYTVLDGEDTDVLNAYEILDIFYYTSYNLTKIIPEIYDPNTSRFGFIAKQGNRVFVVFRGTREPEEWFNNLQPHQIDFFRRSLKINPDHPDVKVHWGFRKIYTKLHPGPFLKYPILNRIFSSPGKAFRSLTDKFARRNAPKNYPSMWEVVERIFNNPNYYSQTDQVFVTGHSLGGALATLAALHIGHLKNCQPIVYTFASPRVGNSGFARYFEKMVGNSFRIANTEDMVPTKGSAAIKVKGLEMSNSPPSNYDKFMNWITDGLYEEGYEHVGKPVVFTCQTRCISSNHNMNAIYCGVVANELL